MTTLKSLSQTDFSLIIAGLDRQHYAEIDAAITITSAPDWAASSERASAVKRHYELATQCRAIALKLSDSYHGEES